VELARAANDRYEIATALLMLGTSPSARAATQAGLGSAAGIPELEEAVEIAQQLGSPSALTWPLSVLGMFLIEVDPRRARQVLDAAIERCRAVDNRQALAGVLNCSGLLHYKDGEPGPALRDLDDAVDLTAQIGDAVSLPEYIQSVSCLLSELGEAEPAAVLHGAADALRAADQSFAPPEVVAWYEQAAETTRAELGDQRFTQLTLDGATMNARQASQYVLEQTRRHESKTVAQWKPSPSNLWRPTQAHEASH
jgi:hypothetical protein